MSRHKAISGNHHFSAEAESLPQISARSNPASSPRTAKHTVYKIAVSLIIAFVLWGSIYGLQRQIDRKAKRSFSDHILLAFPSGQYLKSAALGFDVLIADLIWAHTVVDFGDHVITGKDYAGLYHRLDLITTLDPHFKEAYWSGGILLAMHAGQVDESIMLLERGLEEFPDNWQYYFNLGFNYTFYKNDDTKAIEYFERAADIPGSPAYLSRLIGNLYADTGKIDMALVFLEEAYKQLKDEKMRADIEEKMVSLIVEKHKIILEEAAERYKNVHGRYPNTLQALRQTALIQSIPTPPNGGYYIIDPQTGKVGPRHDLSMVEM